MNQFVLQMRNICPVFGKYFNYTVLYGLIMPVIITAYLSMFNFVVERTKTKK